MADILKIKDRVQAMLAKVTDPACSEEEADAAYKMAMKLMAKYQLSEEDFAGVTGDNFKEFTYEGSPTKSGKYAYHPVDKFLSKTLGNFTATQWFWRNGRSELVIFGLDADVEFATWLRAALVKHYDRDWANYRDFKRKGRTNKDLAGDKLMFSKGFARAIDERFADWQYRSTNDETEFALVCRRMDLVVQELHNRGVHISMFSLNNSKDGSTEAAGAGLNSGRAASLGDGVTKTRNILLGAG